VNTLSDLGASKGLFQDGEMCRYMGAEVVGLMKVGVTTDFDNCRL